jgi:hypothetical protein
VAVQYYNNYVDTTNFSDVTPRMALRAGSPLTYTVPGVSSQAFQVIFSFNAEANVFVGYNTTAAVPVQDEVTLGGFVEFRPLKRFVKGGDVLSFATPDPVAYIGFSLRSLP